MRKRDMFYAFLIWLAALAVGRVALWLLPFWFNVAIVLLLAILCLLAGAVPLALKMYHDSKWAKHNSAMDMAIKETFRGLHHDE